jgi:hypothetical protein
VQPTAPMPGLLGVLSIATLAGCPSPGLAPVQDEEPGESSAPRGWTLREAPDFRSSPPADGVESVEQNEDRTNGGGASLADFTGDGVLDLVLTGPWSGNAVLQGDGEGGFVRVPNQALEAVPLTACAVGVHLDDDGLRDLLLCGDRSVSAWRNQGGALFAFAGDVLDLSDEPARAEDIAITDLWGDGSLVLYVGTQSLANPDGEPPGASADRLLRTTGAFTFEDLSDRLPEQGRIGQTYASSWVDIDGDRDLDLFTVRDRGDRLWPAALFVNPGDQGPWTEEAASWGLDLRIDGMGIATGDLDRDGGLDLLVSDNLSRLQALDVVDGSAVSREQAIGAVVQDPERNVASWGIELVDLENDGDLDLAIAFGRADPLHDPSEQGIELSVWDEGGFVPVDDLDQRPGPAPDAWRAVLPGDLDGDGVMELVFTSHLGGVMIQDPGPLPGGWVRVELQGPSGNRDGLGARVELFDGETEPQRRLVGVGSTGLHSSLEPVAHFGLGDRELERIEVLWPDGSLTTVDDARRSSVVTVRHPLAD